MTADQLVLLSVAVLGGGAIAGTVFYFLGRRSERRLGEAMGRSAAQQADRLLAQARREADADKAEAMLAVKHEILELREAWERESKERRDELNRHQARLEERETLIDRKLNTLDDQAKDLAGREKGLGKRESRVTQRERESEQLVEERRTKLEQVAGLSADDAKLQLSGRRTGRRGRSLGSRCSDLPPIMLRRRRCRRFHCPAMR
jgi:ribonuclease Y